MSKTPEGARTGLVFPLISPSRVYRHFRLQSTSSFGLQVDANGLTDNMHGPPGEKEKRLGTNVLLFKASYQ